LRFVKWLFVNSYSLYGDMLSGYSLNCDLLGGYLLNSYSLYGDMLNSYSLYGYSLYDLLSGDIYGISYYHIASYINYYYYIRCYMIIIIFLWSLL